MKLQHAVLLLLFVSLPLDAAKNKKAAQHASLDAILALATAYSPREFDLGAGSRLAQVAGVNPTEALPLYLQAESVVRSTPGRDAQEWAEKIERKYLRFNRQTFT